MEFYSKEGEKGGFAKYSGEREGAGAGKRGGGRFKVRGFKARGHGGE